VVGDILQPTHLLFILVIALLVLGPKRLPEAGRSLGRGLRDFRTALSGDDHDESDELTTQTTVDAVPAPAQPIEAAVAPEPPLAVAATVASEPGEATA
jgi:sec-independent protein translocase protein TatA